MTLTLSNRFARKLRLFSFDHQRGSTIVTTSKRDYHLPYMDDIDLKHCKVGLFGTERGNEHTGWQWRFRIGQRMVIEWGCLSGD